MEILKALRELADPDSVRFSVVRAKLADWWLDRIRPVWFDFLQRRRRRRPAVLKEVRRPLLDDPLPTEELETIWELNLEIPPLDQRIVAAIVGVGDAKAAHAYHA